MIHHNPRFFGVPKKRHPMPKEPVSINIYQTALSNAWSFMVISCHFPCLSLLLTKNGRKGAAFDTMATGFSRASTRETPQTRKASETETLHYSQPTSTRSKSVQVTKSPSRGSSGNPPAAKLRLSKGACKQFARIRRLLNR